MENFQNDSSGKFSSGSASASYNFVSLPEKILPAPTDERNLSGEISLLITAKTPLFIGNGDDPKSFAPVGKSIIPGSSLRGMFKNIFKVVTCGAFRGQKDFNDEHIYFRCMMKTKSSPDWMTDLHEHYEKFMKDKVSKKKKARPGFLIQCDGKYFIAPTLNPPVGKLIRDYQREFRVSDETLEKSHVDWRGETAYIVTGKQVGKKKYVRCMKLSDVDWDGKRLEISDEVLSAYRHDRNRKGVDLFKDTGLLKREQLAEKLRRLGMTLPRGVESLIPCHYLTKDGDKVTAFGHGQYFRIPYEHSIDEAVPENLRDANVVDFADAVFGCAEICASRVYFEDAVPVEENVHELKSSQVHLLMPPNPTSYQLYLEQNPDDKLTFWDEKDGRVPKIRGYKFYWHNAAYDWKVSQKELDKDAERGGESLIKTMTPLVEGSRFKSKIRFENLSKIELGALMMIFDLDGAENPAYKIGQGKSLGLGSVEIKPTLYVEDEETYAEIFGENGWQNPCREKNPAEYLDAFKNELERCGMKSTWENVMSELKKILDWSLTARKDWREKISSMSGVPDDIDARLLKRSPLPTIFEVVK